jgi:DNA-directed RNA polymerase specialized sigma24 family protein
MSFSRHTTSSTDRSSRDALQVQFEDAVALLRRGDRTALDALHRRLTPGLCRHFQAQLNAAGVAGGLGDGGDLAFELAQRTWEEFWRAAERGVYDSSRARYSTFLYGIAANIWMRARRDRARGVRMRSAEAEAQWQAEAGAQSFAGESTTTLVWAEAIERVRAVIDGGAGDGFSEQDRITLKALSEGASERDLAQRMGVSPSTAHDRRTALLERLRAWLAGKGLEFGESTRAVRGRMGETRESAVRTRARPSVVQHSASAVRTTPSTTS